MDRLYKMQIIEISCTAVAGVVKFPDQPNLRNAVIQNIAVYTAGVITTTPITGGTPMSTANLKDCCVTMQEGGMQVIQNKPILSFNSMIATTDPYSNNPPPLFPRVFSWDKCFLTFKVAPTASVVTLEVWYNDDSVNINV